MAYGTLFFVKNTALIALTFLTFNLSPSSFAQSQSEVASQELSTLDFFSEGQGMHLSPGALNQLESLRSVLSGTRTDETILNTLMHRWGIQEHEGKLVGIKTVRYKNMKIGVLGCVACHSGKAAGQYIIGIGNKNIDPAQIGFDGVTLETELKRLTDVFAELHFKKKSEAYRNVEDSSIHLMKKLSDPRMAASTQGLVPVALVGSWFYEIANEPLPTNGFIGATKVPSWFGFTKKLEIGQFSDAIGKGHPPGWIIGVEFTAGQTPGGVRRYADKIEHASRLIGDLTPPPYPFAIQYERANRGKIIFEQTCAKCHGTYEWDQTGLPIYKAPKIIPLEYIGTDSDRLDYVTEDFLNHVRKSPLSDLVTLSEYAGKRMYVAPRLHAIWARFPYLHNGSVPTLRDLLEPAANRPKIFSLKNAGELVRFDPNRVGLTHPETSQALINLIQDYSGKNRSVYDTGLPGQSNQGHEKFTDLDSDHKDDLIEYLKTL